MVPIFTIALIGYAIGGQKLLRKICPSLAEEEHKKADATAKSDREKLK